MNMKRKYIALAALMAVTLLIVFQLKNRKSSFEKIKTEYEQCLIKIKSFSEEELFNRYIKRTSQIIDYGDGMKYMLPEECKLKRTHSRCAIYNRFDNAEKNCMSGTLKQCQEAILLATRIKADSFELKKKACELGDENWCYFVAVREFTSSTKDALKKSCSRGRGDSCIYLGIVLWNTDRAKAMELITKVNQKHDHEVAGFFGRLGAFDEQMTWLRKVCELGSQGACLNVHQVSQQVRIENFVANSCYLNES
jgi:hypothetical protein